MSAPRNPAACGKRIGPKMAMVVEYVRENPGCPKIEPATWAAPSRYGRVGLGYGYRTVDRAIAAGLVIAVLRGNRYELTLAEED